MAIPGRDTLHKLVAVLPTGVMVAGAIPGAEESPGAWPSGAPGALRGAAPSGAPVQPAPPLAPAPPAPAPAKETIGVFLTPQSLVTFPAASAALVVVWKVLSAVFPAWGPSNLVPFVGAFLLGMFIYYISLPENASRRDRTIGAGIGVINSFFLAASALGVQTVT